MKIKNKNKNVRVLALTMLLRKWNPPPMNCEWVLIFRRSLVKKGNMKLIPQEHTFYYFVYIWWPTKYNEALYCFWPAIEGVTKNHIFSFLVRMSCLLKIWLNKNWANNRAFIWLHDLTKIGALSLLNLTPIRFD